MSKSWKTIAKFDNYNDADAKRNLLSEKTKSKQSIVKVRRCGPGGAEFAVKYWEPPAEVKEPKSKKTKDSKIKRGDKRAEKRARRAARQNLKGDSN